MAPFKIETSKVNVWVSRVKYCMHRCTETAKVRTYQPSAVIQKLIFWLWSLVFLPPVILTYCCGVAQSVLLLAFTSFLRSTCEVNECDRVILYSSHMYSMVSSPCCDGSSLLARPRKTETTTAHGTAEIIRNLLQIHSIHLTAYLSR